VSVMHQQVNNPVFSLSKRQERPGSMTFLNSEKSSEGINI
jgi:hypothetical protein